MTYLSQIRRPSQSRKPFAILLFLLIALCTPMMAHFAQNLVVRVFLTQDHPQGTLVYQDVPVPMLFSDILQDVSTVSKDPETSLIYADFSESQGQIRLSRAAILNSTRAFETRLTDNLIWRDDNGNVLKPTLQSWRISALSEQRMWRSSQEAQSDIERAPDSQGDPEISQVTIQFALLLPTQDPTGLYATLAMPKLNLPDGIQIENHITDLRQDPMLVYSATGQLDRTLKISPTLADRMLEFTWQGVLHVFTGLDHVFLILCVAFSPLALAPLLWRLTAFTLGHSITLIATALGWIITGATFIAWVELAIAVTILYAGLEALRRKSPSVIALFGVGLIHGFGFASVLSVILQPDAPGFVASLLAFNIGIEIAQIIIVLAVFGLLFALRRALLGAEHWVRIAVLLLASTFALIWIFERLPAVM